MSDSSKRVVIVGGTLGISKSLSLALLKALVTSNVPMVIEEFERIDSTPPEDSGLFGDPFNSTPIPIYPYDFDIEPKGYIDQRPIQKWQGQGKRKMPRRDKL